MGLLNQGHSKSKLMRIGDKWLYVDIIKTEKGLIRIGTMPELSKYLKKFNLSVKYVLLPPPVIRETGDNYTGEEFIYWNKIYENDYSPIYYWGESHNVKYLYKRLKYTINQLFNKEKTKIIKQRRLEKMFKGIKVKPDKYYSLDKEGKVKFYFTKFNLQIFEDDRIIYDWFNSQVPVNVHNEVEKLFRRYKSKTKPIDYLEIIPVGIGNGFGGRTSNFIVRYGDRIIWIDPMAKPYLVLKKLKIHWDDITDYLITHVHEDHYEGLSAILARAAFQNRKINLLTTKKIYKHLVKIFRFYFPQIEELINHINLTPGITLPYHHGFITVRLNHHVLKNGTLGIKIQYKENAVGISGDTYWSYDFYKKYKENPAFDPFWFNECQLIFHEVEFERTDTVHTYYKELEKLKKLVNGKVLVYHFSSKKPLLESAKEMKRYRIKKGRIK